METRHGTKYRQLHIEDYLGEIPAEQGKRTEGQEELMESRRMNGSARESERCTGNNGKGYGRGIKCFVHSICRSGKYMRWQTVEREHGGKGTWRAAEMLNSVLTKTIIVDRLGYPSMTAHYLKVRVNY